MGGLLRLLLERVKDIHTRAELRDVEDTKCASMIADSDLERAPAYDRHGLEVIRLLPQLDEIELMSCPGADWGGKLLQLLPRRAKEPYVLHDARLYLFVSSRFINDADGRANWRLAGTPSRRDCFVARNAPRNDN